MTSHLRSLSLLPLAAFSLSLSLHGNVSAQEACVVKGNTLNEARNVYAAQCNVRRVDCDPYGDEWFCASFSMRTSTPPALTEIADTSVTEATASSVAETEVSPAEVTAPPVVVEPVVAEEVSPAPVTITRPVVEADVTPPVAAAVSPITVSTVNPSLVAAAVGTEPRERPVCRSASSDSDGDGFGWENNATCLVTRDTPSPSSAQGDSRPVCQSSASDPDGDGFGWENNRTCLIAETTLSEPAAPSTGATTSATSNRPVCTSADSDADGDGFGFENNTTCIVAASSQEPRVTTQSGSITAADITDLILVTGQSNALGAQTSFNAQLDAVNRSVFAFTNEGWQVADLHQIWDLNWHPRNHPNTDPSNNFAFHFGKTVAERRDDRVVGFILASAPGAAISHWDINRQFYGEMEAKVLDAINQLPHKSALDGILWHQGESDGRDEQVYTDALNALISNLRSEPWAETDIPFICGETKIPSVNRRLNRLNSDNDPNTACVAGEDLPTRGDNRHFNAAGLRTLGARYGTTYLSIRP